MDSDGGSEDTFQYATGLQIMIVVNYKYNICSMCITYVSVIIQHNLVTALQILWSGIYLILFSINAIIFSL